MTSWDKVVYAYSLHTMLEVYIKTSFLRIISVGDFQIVILTMKTLRSCIY